MDTGAIVGLSLGVVIAVLAIVALVLCCCLRKPRQTKKAADPEKTGTGFDNPLYGKNELNQAVSMKELMNQQARDKRSENFNGGRERFPSSEMGLFVGQDLLHKTAARSNSFTNPLFEEGVPSLATQSSVDLYHTQGPVADLALDMASGTLKIHGVPDSPDGAHPSPVRSPASQRKVQFSDVVEVKVKTPSVGSDSSTPSAPKSPLAQATQPPGSPGRKTPPNKPRRLSSRKNSKQDSPPISRLGITMDAQVGTSNIKVIRDNSIEGEGNVYVEHHQMAFANPLAERFYEEPSEPQDSVKRDPGASSAAELQSTELNPFGTDNFADYSPVTADSLHKKSNEPQDSIKLDVGVSAAGEFQSVELNPFGTDNFADYSPTTSESLHKESNVPQDMVKLAAGASAIGEFQNIELNPFGTDNFADYSEIRAEGFHEDPNEPQGSINTDTDGLSAGDILTPELNPFGSDKFADYPFGTDSQLGFVDLGHVGESSTDDTMKSSLTDPGHLAEPAAIDSEERADKLLEIPLDAFDPPKPEVTTQNEDILQAPSVYQSINMETAETYSNYTDTTAKGNFDDIIMGENEDNLTKDSSPPPLEDAKAAGNTPVTSSVLSTDLSESLDLHSGNEPDSYHTDTEKVLTEGPHVSEIQPGDGMEDKFNDIERLGTIGDAEQTDRQDEPIESHQNNNDTGIESQLLAAFEDEITPESVTDTSSSFVAIDPSSSGDFSNLPKDDVQGALVVDTSSNLGTPKESPSLISPIVAGDVERKSSPSSNESADDSSFMMVDSDAVYAQVIKIPKTQKADETPNPGANPEQFFPSSPGLIVSSVASADLPFQIHQLEDDDKERSSSVSSCKLKLQSSPTLPKKTSPAQVRLRVISTSSAESEDESGYVKPRNYRRLDDQPSPTYERLRFDSEPNPSSDFPAPDTSVLSSSFPDTFAPPVPTERVPETTSSTGSSSDSEANAPPLPARPESLQDISTSFETLDDSQRVETTDSGAAEGNAPDLSKLLFQPESEFAERLKKRKERKASKEQQKSSKKKKKNSSKSDDLSNFRNPFFEEDNRPKDESKNMPMVDVPLPVKGKASSVKSKKKSKSKSGSPSSSSSSDSEIEHIMKDTQNLV